MKNRIRLGAIRTKLMRCTDELWRQYVSQEIEWENFPDQFYLDPAIPRSESPGKIKSFVPEENPFASGFYKPMESKADLLLFPLNAASCILKPFANYQKTLPEDEALLLMDQRYFVSWLQIFMELTLIHLSFHHSCDVVQHIAPFFRNPSIEEPLALAFALSQLKMDRFLNNYPKKLRKSTQRFLCNLLFKTDFYPEFYCNFPQYLNRNKDFTIESFEDYIARDYPKKTLKREILSRIFMHSFGLYSNILFKWDKPDFIKS